MAVEFKLYLIVHTRRPNPLSPHELAHLLSQLSKHTRTNHVVGGLRLFGGCTVLSEILLVTIKVYIMDAAQKGTNCDKLDGGKRLN